MRKCVIVAVSMMSVVNISGASADDIVSIGVLAPLKGSYTVLGEDAVRGVETAVSQLKDTLGETKIQLFIKSTDNSVDSVLTAAKSLIKEDDVRIIIGPSSSDAGVAIRDFSKTQPNVTFINGISSAPEATYINPSENFFRFNTDSVQWSSGLGDYVFNEKEFRRVAIVADDYPFNHAQVFGFEKEYCSAGGEIADKRWIKSGERNFDDVIASLPDDIDGIYLGLAGSDALTFLGKYKEANGKAKPIGSSITADGFFLGASDGLKNLVIGMPLATPQVDTWSDEGWQSYVKSYKDNFPSDQRFEFPSIFATGYYNAAKAALICISNMGDFQQEKSTALHTCLSNLELDAPNGPIVLDENRQAIGNNYVAEITEQPDGRLVKKLVRISENISQSTSLGKEDISGFGKPGHKSPSCNRKNN